MDHGWDLHAVVRSCATSSSSTAAAEITPATTVHRHEEGFYRSGFTFDDGQSAREEPSMFSNFISFAMEPVDCEHLFRKRRKSKNKKRVIETREDESSNDGWAWRKYGQKPIKGSPYPRNYYRCSTSKDCSARKQVERSTIDASSYIVSYTGDHLHPRPTHLSSLAGTSRSTKFSAVVATGSSEKTPCASSSPASTSGFYPVTSLKEHEIKPK
ncbi:hypothetical protein R6Q59_036384 [Mikania micrantha]